MKTIVLKPIANQSFEFFRDNQRFKVELLSRGGKTYLSYFIDRKAKLLNRICLDRVVIDEIFMFEDTKGKENPYFTGFSERFKLRLLQ